ncbi:MAG: hypothetical protein K1X88_21705 [Nannocystaceae bacterium]|nr:hypothetical protein [Nannocystaceae bacterium]
MTNATLVTLATLLCMAAPARAPKPAAKPAGAPASASATAPSKPAPPAAAPATAAKPAPAAADGARPAPGAAAPATADTAPPSTGPASPSDEGGEDVTRYTFTGLDIEGELRTPALLQFLARIGGEFETVGIPHRSFMPELAQTVAQDAL